LGFDITLNSFSK